MTKIAPRSYNNGTTVSNGCASVAPLVADVIGMVPGWTDLPSYEQRDQQSALRNVMRICTARDDRTDPDGPTPALPPTMSAAYLNTKLFRRPPATYGMTERSFANFLSRLRKILRRMEGHDAPWAGRDALSPSWRILFDALPTQHRQISLSAFMRYCSEQDIEPEAVTADGLVEFEAHLLNRTLCKDAPIRARGVASNWTWARINVSGWPDLPLTRPRTREQYVLPLKTFLAPLQADAEKFLNSLAFTTPDDIFSDDAPTSSRGGFRNRRALSARTIEGRRFQIRQCLSAMVIMGRDPTTITSLRDLVGTPEQVVAILKFFIAKAGNKRTSQTGQIGELLRQLARFHCQLDDKAVALITDYTKRAAPKQNFAMTEQNLRRLNVLLQPSNRLKFLNLPGTLMKEAEAEDSGSRAAALLAMYAVALDILLVFPVRRSNLAHLHLDNHLQRTDPKRRVVDFINIPESETKTGVGLTWPLPKEVADRLEIYLRHYRPQLTVSGNRHLFPQTTLGPRSPHDLAVGLTKVVEERIGCEFNLHLVRHFVVALHLLHNPGQYDTARQLLGHAKASYTIQVYDGLGASVAARQLDETLKHERRAPPSKLTIKSKHSSKPKSPHKPMSSKEEAA